MDKDYNKYIIWLTQIVRINNKTKHALLSKFTLEELYNISLQDINIEADYFVKNRITKDTILELTDKKYKANINKYINALEKMNIRFITYKDRNYPKKLKQIFDYPLCLFYKGDINLLNKKSIGIVGSRQATDYGLAVAKNFSIELSKKGFTIVSGGARGIDTMAHIGAMKNKGNTILIKGNSLEYIYPPENKNLEEEILSNNGLLLSEYIVGTRPSKYSFPARNRIISGLADGVLVVEAGSKSGALITADLALGYNREVYAIPGNITSKNSLGTNILIKQGAKVVTEVNDILEEF